MQRKMFWTVFAVLGLVADLAFPFWWALAATIPIGVLSWWVAYRSDWFSPGKITLSENPFSRSRQAQALRPGDFLAHGHLPREVANEPGTIFDPLHLSRL